MCLVLVLRFYKRLVAHMSNIAGILDAAGPGSLVLLDEIAAGTDPAEGAALAEALLEHLTGTGATVLSTTHYDVLKSRAQEKDAFVNAAMGFDPQAGRPTFELRPGLPGSSSAIRTAETYGIPEPVVGRARELLPEGMRRLSNAVAALDEEKRRTELERRALAEQRQALNEAERRTQREVRMVVIVSDRDRLAERVCCSLETTE